MVMNIAVGYDRTKLAVNDTVEVSVHVELKEGAAGQPRATRSGRRRRPSAPTTITTPV
jgi:hypothetical protein